MRGQKAIDLGSLVDRKQHALRAEGGSTDSSVFPTYNFSPETSCDVIRPGSASEVCGLVKYVALQLSVSSHRSH